MERSRAAPAANPNCVALAANLSLKTHPQQQTRTTLPPTANPAAQPQTTFAKRAKTTRERKQRPHQRTPPPKARRRRKTPAPGTPGAPARKHPAHAPDMLAKKRNGHANVAPRGATLILRIFKGSPRNLKFKAQKTTGLLPHTVDEAVPTVPTSTLLLPSAEDLAVPLAPMSAVGSGDVGGLTG